MARWRLCRRIVGVMNRCRIVGSVFVLRTARERASLTYQNVNDVHDYSQWSCLARGGLRRDRAGDVEVEAGLDMIR
jgi:hypothetical protein